MSPSEKAARLRSMKQDFCRCGTYRCIINTDRDALEAGAEAIEARASDPVRAALAVPGVADALAWAMRTYTLTDEYGAMRADATGAMNDALRALADAARGSK